jgi:hypothetical protein
VLTSSRQIVPLGRADQWNVDYSQLSACSLSWRRVVPGSSFIRVSKASGCGLKRPKRDLKVFDPHTAESRCRFQPAFCSVGAGGSVPRGVELITHLHLAAKVKSSRTISPTASVVQWSEFLTTDTGSRVRFPGTTKKSSRSRTGSSQPREYN